MPGIIKQDLDENIWIAAGEGRLEDVEKYLKGSETASPLDPNISDEFGYTALHAAASYAHCDLIRLLLDYGANVNITDMEGDTPLHLVENVDAAKLLIENGADPTIRNDDQRLAIEIAFMEGCMDVVEYLVQFTPHFEKIEEEDVDANFDFNDF